VELCAGCSLYFSQVFINFFSQIVNVFWCVFVLDYFDGKVDFLVEAVAAVILVVFGYSVVYLDA